MKINEFKAAYDLDWAISECQDQVEMVETWVDFDEHHMELGRENGDIDMYSEAKRDLAQDTKLLEHFKALATRFMWAFYYRGTWRLHNVTKQKFRDIGSKPC